MDSKDTKSQSFNVKEKTLNILAIGGIETIDIWRMIPIKTAPSNFLFLNRPILKTDTFSLLIAKESISCEPLKTTNDIVWAWTKELGYRYSPTLKANKVVKPIITPSNIKVVAVPLENRLSLGLRGFSNITLGSLGSTPSAKAGKLSVIRFIHNIWIGNRGEGQLRSIATNKVSTSPKLLLSKNTIDFFYIVKYISTFFYCFYNSWKIIISKNHICSTFCNISSCNSHGYTYISKF